MTQEDRVDKALDATIAKILETMKKAHEMLREQGASDEESMLYVVAAAIAARTLCDEDVDGIK